MKSYNIYYTFWEFFDLVAEHGFAPNFNDIGEYFKTKYNAQLVECDQEGVHYYVLKFNTEKYLSNK
jgi:hypothetical protein